MMLDFVRTEPTLLNNLYCLVFYLFLVLITMPNIWYRSRLYKTYYNKRFLLFVCFFILSVTFFSAGDFYHYQSMVHNYDFTRGGYNHGEYVYGLIVDLVNSNYLLFRIIVWGVSLILMVLTCNRFSVNFYYVLIFVLITHIITFSYARATLAMAIFYYGLSYWCKPNSKHKFLSILLGAALIVMSFFFHISMIVPILFSAVVFIPFSRKSFKWLLVVSPILIILFKTAFPYFLDDNFSAEMIQERLFDYVELETIELNWKGKLMNFLGYSIYYVLALLIYLYGYRDETQLPKSMLMLSRFVIVIILMATIFLFLDLENKVFFYRTLYMVFIPSSILWVELYRYKLIPSNVFRFVTLYAFVGVSGRLLYNVYSLSIL